KFRDAVEILEADNLQDALKVVEVRRESIAAIILDLDIPRFPDEPAHDTPVPVGLDLLGDEAWFCPVIIFSAHEDIINNENLKKAHPWHMISKNAADSLERLVEQVRRGLQIQEMSASAIRR